MTSRLPLVINGGQVEQLQAGDALTGIARAYAVTIGDGTSTAITVTHGLGTNDVQVSCYRVGSPYDDVVVDVARSTTKAVVLTFATAPAASSLRVVVIG